MFTYDQRGRVTSTRKIFLDAPIGVADTSFEYDDADRVIETHYPDGEIVHTGYDETGQPEALWNDDMESYIDSVRYDLFGRITEMKHGNTVTDTRDYHGKPGESLTRGHRLERVKTAKQGGPTYLDIFYESYDPRGLIAQTREDVPGLPDILSNELTYQYDHMGRLLSTVGTNAWTIYNYDALGNITRKLGAANPPEAGFDITLTYSPYQPHQPIVISKSGQGGTIGHDQNGNRSEKNSNEQTYQYTPDDRLESVTVGSDTVNFTYDYDGRRVKKEVVGGAVTRYYSNMVETISDGIMTKSYYLGGLRVASRSSNDVGWQYTAQVESPIQVASAWLGRPALVLFLRSDVQVVFGSAATLLAVALLVAPWRRKRIAGIAVRHGHVIGVVITFTLGTSPVPILFLPATAHGQSPTPTTGCTGCDCPTPTPVPFTEEVRHYHFDHLGSTQVITDENGNVVEQIRYMPYGSIRGRWDAAGVLITSPDPNQRYEFTGYETEVLSGLQYAGARFYDPELGSFLTHDPMRQFVSPYTYTNWNPVNLVDPDGQEAGWVLVGLALVFLAAAANAIDTAIQTRDAEAAAGSFATSLFFGLYSAGLGFAVAQAVPTAVNVAIGLAQVGYGGYATYEGFRNERYATGGVGVIALAIGVYSLTRGFSQGRNGGLARAGGENETALQQLGDAADLVLQPKEQVVPNTAEYTRIEDALNTIPNTSVRGESLQRLQWGDYYVYEQRWGGADALTWRGRTYVPTTSLDFESGYLGYQLTHEHFHVLEGIYPHSWLPNESAANRFTAFIYDTPRPITASSQRLYSRALGRLP